MNKNTTFVPYPSLPHKITINWNLRCRHTTTVDPISYKLAYTGYTGQVTTDSTHPGPRMLRSYWTFASIYSVFPLQFNCFIRLDNLLELLFCSLSVILILIRVNLHCFCSKSSLYFCISIRYRS